MTKRSYGGHWTRIQWHRYNRTRRRYKRAIIRFLRHRYYPYDYGGLLQIVGLRLDDYADYWSQGVNVHCTDETREELRDIAAAAQSKRQQAIAASEGGDTVAEVEYVKAAFEFLGQHLCELWD